MSILPDFSEKSKEKMKKMINLSYKDGVEYFTIIKKDYSLGEITKGVEGACYPNDLIKSNMGNVIGSFHTHPYTKEFYDQAISKSEGFFKELKKSDIKSEEIKKMKEYFPKALIKTFSKMSVDDLRFVVSRGFTVECIGFKDNNDKSRVFCHLLHKDSKERFIKNCSLLDSKMKEVFLEIFKNWLNNKKSEVIVESSILMIISEWVIKETFEISV